MRIEHRQILTNIKRQKGTYIVDAVKPGEKSDKPRDKQPSDFSGQLKAKAYAESWKV